MCSTCSVDNYWIHDFQSPFFNAYSLWLLTSSWCACFIWLIPPYLSRIVHAACFKKLCISVITRSDILPYSHSILSSSHSPCCSWSMVYSRLHTRIQILCKKNHDCSCLITGKSFGMVRGCDQYFFNVSWL